MKIMKRAFSVLLAGVFAASMCVAPALAQSAPIVVPDRTYTVSISGGNQGLVSVGGSEYKVDYSNDVEAGSAFASTVSVEVTNSKYYVKGLRDTSVNNAYINDYVVNGATEENGVYTMPVSFNVTEDTNLVVAYGIKGEMVNYTVEYKYGDQLLGTSETFQAQRGDKPSPIAKYFEGYIPVANQQSKTLDADNTVITFNYYKLDPIYRTIYENETIIIITPEGEEITVTPATAEAIEAAGGVIPVTTEDGEEVLTEDGTPLATPVEEENLDDDENPLASGEAAAAGDAEGIDATSILTWLLPVLAALVVAGLVVFFALLLRNKRKESDQGSGK